MKIPGIGVPLLVLGALGLAQSSVSVTRLGFDGDLERGVPAPWIVKRVKGKPDFEVVSIPDRGAEKYLLMRSKKSSFSLNRRVDLDLDTWRYASWSWQGIELPTGKAADARIGKKCDQGLQVLFAFDRGSRLISYVWDTNAPVDTRTTEGFRFLGMGKTVKVIVVQSGTDGVGTWSTIRRDLLSDYRQVYGEKSDPRKVVAVRIQSNSQYTGTKGSGYFGPIAFEPSPP